MKSGVFQGNLLSVVISIVITTLMILIGKNILMLFISADKQQTAVVLKYAYDYLFVMAICLPVLYILYSYRSALQGMENTFIPMLSGIVELIIRVTVALILPKYIGEYGIYLAEVLAWFGAAIMLYISYRIQVSKIEVK